LGEIRQCVVYLDTKQSCSTMSNLWQHVIRLICAAKIGKQWEHFTEHLGCV